MKLTIAITPELRFRLTHAETLDIEVPEPTMVVPEGWQLVPVDATPEMLSIGALYPDSYADMLAAAPKPENTDETD